MYEPYGSQNAYNIIHVWEEDRLTTICGIPKEICLVSEPVHGRAVYQCQDCYHILAGHVKYDPTPAERALIEAVLGA